MTAKSGDVVLGFLGPQPLIQSPAFTLGDIGRIDPAVAVEPNGLSFVVERDDRRVHAMLPSLIAYRCGSSTTRFKPVIKEVIAPILFLRVRISHQAPATS